MNLITWMFAKPTRNLIFIYSSNDTYDINTDSR
jgi:hypothetical protein